MSRPFLRILCLQLFRFVFGSVAVLTFMGACASASASAFVSLFVVFVTAVAGLIAVDEQLRLCTVRPITEFLGSPDSVTSHAAQRLMHWQIQNPGTIVFLCLPLKSFRRTPPPVKSLRVLIVHRAGSLFCRIDDPMF